MKGSLAMNLDTDCLGSDPVSPFTVSMTGAGYLTSLCLLYLIYQMGDDNRTYRIIEELNKFISAAVRTQPAHRKQYVRV